LNDDKIDHVVFSSAVLKYAVEFLLDEIERLFQIYEQQVPW